MKILGCAKCGCQRSIIVKARVRLQETHIEPSLGWLCIPCLLEVIGIDCGDGKYDKKIALKIVED